MGTLLDERTYGMDHEEENITGRGITFEVSQASLMSILTVCEGIIPKSGAAMPILQSIKFDLINETLFVTATDVTQSLLYQLDVKNVAGVNGSYLFPAKEGIELIKRLPRKTLTLEQQDSTLLITYGANRTAMVRILDAEQYPALPSMESVEQLSIPYETLRRSSIGTLFASMEESTPALLGIHIHCCDGRLAFSATDRHRIFNFVSDVAIMDPDSFSSGIVPAKNFKRIVDSFKGAKSTEEYELGMTHNYLILRNSSFVYFGKLLEANFPDLQRTLNAADQGKMVSFSRKEMSETLYRALSLKTENNRITLEVNAAGEFIVHKASEDNEVREEIPNAVVEEGEYPVMKFNGEFLKETLLMGDPTVDIIQLRLTGQRNPGYVTLEGDPSVLAILLPCV
ncbi:DNA polymerase III subunit beta (plasmid) [Paenibacillus sonchi]|uniref:DNA polymerase III subunit beta n=1 Tax=Paenibacillus sonchi TaxID=373687 RepID=A0A974PIF3_9BACL|nr:DNA polymerase III subunit beta [Paenibacillus sonchi]QQZ64532.1 DNA polymerase III subunit beta [Paenibacillus sonchi]